MLTYAQLIDENRRLRELVAEQQVQLAEQQVQLAEMTKLQTAVVKLTATVESQAAEIERLKRRGRRQAAPFSKGSPKSAPKKPGRKKGKEYGTQAKRSVPRQVDRTVQVECPLYCPHCASRVRLEGQARQFQIDLPEIRPQTTEFVLQQGRCSGCGRQVQGRHPEQVCDATSVGKVHFGPSMIGLTAHLNKICGLSFGKIAMLLAVWLGLRAHRSSLCRAVARFANKARPTRTRLVEKIRGSPVVTADETGWKVAGLRAWLWGFATEQETVYQIERGRGFAEASKVLGEDFSGVLIVDGWAPYRRFEQATLQTCLTHLLRRCSDLLEVATAGAVRFPRAVRAILEKALEVRDRRDAETLTKHGVRVVCGHLRAKMDRLLSGRFTNAENLRFANHLRRYQDALFIFLLQDGVEATNWRAEHAMRAGVMTRKCNGGGNRTAAGAETQAILMTLFRTMHQKSLNPRQVATEILCAPTPLPNLSVVD